MSQPIKDEKSRRRRLTALAASGHENFPTADGLGQSLALALTGTRSACFCGRLPARLCNVPRDDCAGLHAEQAMEPRAPAWMQNLCVALLVLSLVLPVVNSALWYAYRELPRLQRVRYFWITKGAELALIFESVMICVRIGVLDPQTGLSTQPCNVTVGLYLASLALIASSYFMRLFIAVSQSRRARLVRVFQTGFNDDESSSQVSSPSSILSESLTDFLLGLIRLAFGLDSGRDEEEADEGKKIAGEDGAAIIVRGEGKNKLLARFSRALRPQTLLFMGMFILVPFLIPLIILLTAVDVYKTPSCQGCRIYWELMIAYLLTFNLYAPLGFRLQVSILGAVLTVPAGIILLIVDPGLTDYNKSFAFEWFIWASGLWPVLVWTPLQVWLGVAEERRHRNKVQHQTADRSKLDTALSREEMVRRIHDPAFMDFAEKQFVVESVRFLQDTVMWKRLFFEKSAHWRKQKARILLDTYILPGSPMEVNISFNVRMASINAASAFTDEGGGVDNKMFDRAVGEIEVMLSQGAWMMFVLDREERNAVAVAGV
jgi:hypothetical protein